MERFTESRELFLRNTPSYIFDGALNSFLEIILTGNSFCLLTQWLHNVTK